MTIASPYLLFALVAVPLAALAYLVLERRRARRAAGWSKRAMEPNIVVRPPRRLRYVPALLFLVALALLLVGFARPERLLGSTTSGGAIVTLVVDTSGSMAATDVGGSRIQAAHALALRFLDQLPSRYRVAVLTFADTVKLKVQPTFDRKQAAAAIPDRITPLGGTEVGDAIDEALAVTVEAVGKGLPGSRYPPGAMLLLSDGAQTDVGTNPGDAAQQSLTQGIPIDTVAFGTQNGVVQQSSTSGGHTTTQTIAVPVDSFTLSRIAQTTNGTFFTGSTTTDLSKVWDHLGRHSARGREGHDVSRVLAAAAFLCMLAGIALSGLWFGRIA
ncbi:MAG: VWA domain-containing protein [Actinobacteria bacterium]|nr:VWA domain-containing protein [Actinomycetota bacterium]